MSESEVSVVTEDEFENPKTYSTGNGKEGNIITLERIKAGEQPFAAWSYCSLRVVQDSIVNTLRVPIKSIGIAEVMERIARKAPTPPTTMKAIGKDSPEGLALNLKKSQIVEVINKADPKYLEQTRDYELNSTYEMILHGLAIDLLDEDGTVVVKANDNRSATQVFDVDKAIKVLKGSGLTDQHFGQLVREIQKLTASEQERVDME